MEITKYNAVFKKELYGIYTRIAFGQRGKSGTEAMNRLWDILKKNQVQHKGINHWVYIRDDVMFVGVELISTDNVHSELEKCELQFSSFLYYRHVGPYYYLPSIHQEFEKKIKEEYNKVKYPIIEIFGPWQEDESKLETDLIYPV